MKECDLKWMNYSIEIANDKYNSTLRVGAVLVSVDNTLVHSSFIGENNILSWLENLLFKLKTKNIKKSYNLYLTVNTLSSNEQFDLNELLNKIGLNNVYRGLDITKQLSYYLKKTRFNITESFPTNIEIYVSATVAKKE